MELNAYILDWTMTNYSLLKRQLADAGFALAKEQAAEHLRVVVPFERVCIFAEMIQAHLNAPFNYVDVQYPAEKRTVIIFQQAMFTIINQVENECVRQWAIEHGLPSAQADWATSF